MNNNFKKTIYRITLEGNEELLSWTISHYMHSIVSTYIKLTTISNIISFVNKGIELQDFIICKSPKDLYKAGKENYSENELENSYISFSEENDFWDIFMKKNRPNVFVKINNFWKPVFSDNSNLSLQIRKIEINSPPKFTFEGLGESINALRFGKNIETRLEKKEEIKNLADLINIQTLLDNSKMTPEHKRKFQEKIDKLLDNQEELNKKAHICQATIDILA